MMKRCLLLLASFSLFVAAPAGAVIIIDLVGDKDGFGLAGAPAVPADGTLWRDGLGGVFFTDSRDAGDLATAPFTDIWAFPGSIMFSHNYALGGLIAQSAVLSIQIAGIHDINTGDIYEFLVDGVQVGVIPPNFNANAFQEVLLYNFIIPVALVNGSESIMVQMTGGDGYSINFSELTVSAIPEPSGLLLFSVGTLLVGRALRRRAA